MNKTEPTELAQARISDEQIAAGWKDTFSADPPSQAAPSPAPDISPGCEMARDWCVTVEVFGRPVLTISDNGYSGLSDLDPWESTIRGCAQHLLSFTGTSVEQAAPDPAKQEPVLWANPNNIRSQITPDQKRTWAEDLVANFTTPLYTRPTPPDALRESHRELVAALRPFANYACDVPCDCHNCRARAALTRAMKVDHD